MENNFEDNARNETYATEPPRGTGINTRILKLSNKPVVYSLDALDAIVGKKRFTIFDVELHLAEKILYVGATIVSVFVFLTTSLIAYIVGFEWTLWHVIPMSVLLLIPVCFTVLFSLMCCLQFHFGKKSFVEKQRQARKIGLM